MTELNPDDYTVAWIAPLEIEARAALLMLDNRHRGRFPVGRGDDYLFHAGEICGHNVIIATLPTGQEYGTGSAAALAGHVKAYFHNLWFGLLVGVAAGVPKLSGPAPRDIRLGDILVAVPDGESSGVIAYELGKETGKDGLRLLRAGNILVPTAPVVRSAIGQIKVNAPDDVALILPFYDQIKHQAHENGTFGDPGQTNDIFYETNNEGLQQVAYRESRLESRRTRIWYGPIGSGEKLMRDAQRRDELRDKFNIIGLEMEAAGTMNRIPVGVVRGVCDYADEHKNKDWQPYAAAMAAAYAKAILTEIHPKIIRLSNSLHNTFSGLSIRQAVTPIRPPIRLLPFSQNEDVVDRDIFDELESRLPPSDKYQSAALWGLGGSGKTQIALEFAYRRCQDPACSVFWVQADNETTLIQDYKVIARHFEIADTLENKELLRTVRERLEKDPHWVLIFDNADDLGLFGVGRQDQASPSTMNDAVPRGTTGTVLWTTRDQRIAGTLVSPKQAIKVSRMIPDEAKILFQRTRNKDIGDDEAEDAAELLAELDCLPLAVSQAAASMRRTLTPIKGYLSKLRRGKARWKLLKESEFDRHRRLGVTNSILETWSLSIEHIRQENKVAFQILHILAFINNQNIPFELIRLAACYDIRVEINSSREDVTSENTNMADYETNSEADVDSIVLAITKLREFSFLNERTADDGSRAYEMHKLVQEATRYGLQRQKPEDREAYFALAAVNVVRELFPVPTSPESWPQCERYLIHAQEVTTWVETHQGQVQASQLLRDVSLYFYDCARWREKEVVDTRQYNLLRQALGPRHPDTLLSLETLASTYHSLGKYDEVLKLDTEVLALRQEILGARHPNTLLSLSNLASTYDLLGRYDEALKLDTEVLALRREILGPRHPNTLSSLSNLASTYDSLGRYDEVLKLNTEVLALRREVLGPRHPNTLSSLANLASTYHSLGRYNEALKLDTEVLPLRQEILGPRHPETLLSIGNLASTYRSLGRYDEALKLNTEALTLRREVLGPRNRNTLLGMESLASTYRLLGRYDEALELNTEVLALRREILGPRHPNTLSSLANLASTYRSLGRFDEAFELNTEALALRREILGPRHPNTLSSIANLASTYDSLGRYNEALELNTEVLPLRREVLGLRHPDTLSSLESLASIYCSLERFDEALELNTEVLALRREILGPRHPHTLLSIENLALTYRSLGRFDEALELNTEVLPLRQEVLGVQHVETLHSMQNLALTLHRLQRIEEALSMIQKCHRMLLESLGLEHPQTQSALDLLSSWQDNAETSAVDETIAQGRVT